MLFMKLFRFKKWFWFFAHTMLVLTATSVVFAQGNSGTAVPNVQVLSLYAYPEETTANKLSGVFVYPEVRLINVVLELDLRGYAGERELSIFLTLSDDKKVLKKKKEKYKLAEGAYKFDFPHMLDLKSVFQEKKIKIFSEVTLSGAPIVVREEYFEVKGRELPKLYIEDFLLFSRNWQSEDYFYPGDSFNANLYFRVQGLEERERLEIRVVGVIEDDYGLKIEPEGRYFPYETFWEDGAGPRGDGRYIFVFNGSFPNYFYDYGRFEHPFTIHVLFLLDEVIVERVRLHGEVRVKNPGIEYESPDEEARTIKIEHSSRWRLRKISEDYQIEDRPEY